jgi:hypothetical protein
MPKKKPNAPAKLESKLSPIPQLSAIKILEILNKGEVHSSALSRNQAVEMKKPRKESSGSESKRNSKIWLAKKTPIQAAPYEVVGQEILRFLSPVNQQKTRFFLINDSLGVMSEKISFSGTVKTNKKQNYPSEFLRGLGASTLLSLFTNETDLKLEHLDAKSGVKIDGDWMFSSLISPEIFSKGSMITENDINALPYVDQYKAHNWLDQIEESKKTKGTLMFSNLTLEEKKIIREGINLCMLYILLLPNQVLIDFVSAYIKNENIKDKMCHFLLERKNQISLASFKNRDFLDFISNKKEDDKNIYLRKIKNFITYNKNFLITDKEYSVIKVEVNRLFSGLQSQVKKSKSIDDHGKINKSEKSARVARNKR